MRNDDFYKELAELAEFEEMEAINQSRRRFVTGAGAALAVAGLGAPAMNLLAGSPVPQPPMKTLRGNRFKLDIGATRVNFTGKSRIATTVNGTVPSPILRWKEGQRVTLDVTNHLDESSSIHWHGIILPERMDGVPGISFDGIAPGKTYHYEFDVRQNGTYWYHSHSGFQEQTGMYGAIIVDPIKPPPYRYDREYVVQLSDWSDENPHRIYSKLKKMSDYYNFYERTSVDLLREIKRDGIKKTWAKRKMWNKMRMSPRDLADVTGYTYTFLVNGQTPDRGWTGLFKRGERVLLRFINSAAMSFFDVRIPGLKMTVVAADGQYVHPFTIDEFRIGVAETYDVLVEPKDDRAYTIFCQSIDRTGYARGTLTPDLALKGVIPKMDPLPILTHTDMGMDMSGMDHSMHGKSKGMDHSMHGMHHGHTGHKSGNKVHPMNGRAGYGNDKKVTHVATEFGPHVDMRSQKPLYRLDDPGVGLRNNGRRVLTYRMLKNLYTTPDRRDPGREIELHLTGNMSRYMWSVNGIKFADAEPLRLKFGERVRITLVNDTMMNHPMHLHGMWSDLETGDGKHIPRKHTVIVQPGAKISYLVTADAMGGWAYHCHLIYHMLGMFRKVVVS